MQEYSKMKNFEKAAELRDKIQDLRYLSQRIDIDFGDTEEEFKQIQETRFLAGIKEVMKVLGLNIPEHRIKSARIECYDISNLAGEITYGSMVVSEGATVKLSKYRVFKIRDEHKPSDPDMMARVLQRRVKYFDNSGDGHTRESLLERPHIILLDGAQPQLSAVKKLIPKNIGLLAISKGKHLKRSGKKQADEFWRIDSEGKFRKFSLENPFLFQHLRDEAHRFAIKHMRKGKRYIQKKSVLDDIPGIGPKRRKMLMQHFKSVDKIAAASVKKLNEILKNKKAAKQVHKFFSEPQDSTKRSQKKPLHRQKQ